MNGFCFLFKNQVLGQTSGCLRSRKRTAGRIEQTQIMCTVSVIVIGRNKAQRIERCLRSVFASLHSRDDCEVIYVDSASEDDTVAIASRFPIRILQLRQSWKLSPSAGRYIGYQHARGKYLLFIDGDSLLFKRWLTKACEYLEKNPACGGVGGIMHQAYLCATAPASQSPRITFRKTRRSLCRRLCRLAESRCTAKRQWKKPARSIHF